VPVTAMRQKPQLCPNPASLTHDNRAGKPEGPGRTAAEAHAGRQRPGPGMGAYNLTLATCRAPAAHTRAREIEGGKAKHESPRPPTRSCYRPAARAEIQSGMENPYPLPIYTSSLTSPSRHFPVDLVPLAGA
jgi:hypothetical protein